MHKLDFSKKIENWSTRTFFENLAGFMWGLSCYVGISGQQGFLDLCAILLPVLVFRFRFAIPRSLLVSAIALCAMWLVFPLANYFSWFFPSHPSIGEYLPLVGQSHGVMQSLIPATGLTTGVMLLAYRVVGTFSPLLSGKRLNQEWLIYFWYGLLFGMAVLGCYFTIQYFTGVDFRGESRFLGAHNLMGERYRVPGFFGHPLTMASVSLAWCAAAWSLVATYEGSPKNLPPRPVLIAIGILSLLFIWMSGGRMAQLIAMGIVLYQATRWLASQWSHWSRRRKVWLVISLALLTFPLIKFFAGAFLWRFMELQEKWLAGGVQSVERFTFWQVYWQMFLDSPIYGQGHAWIDQAIRDQYYIALGFADFHQKYNAHNLWLEILGSAGTLGLVVIVTSVVVLIKAVQVYGAGDSDTRKFTSALGLALASNLLHGLTQNTFFDASVFATYMTLLWLFIWSVAQRLD